MTVFNTTLALPIAEELYFFFRVSWETRIRGNTDYFGIGIGRGGGKAATKSGAETETRLRYFELS